MVLNMSKDEIKNKMDTMVDNQISLFDMFVIESLNEILNKKDFENVLISMLATKVEKEFGLTKENAKNSIKKSFKNTPN
jgi:hypothetical protein